MELCIGDKVGKLTYLGKLSKLMSSKQRIYLKFLCDCGKEVEIRKGSIEKSNYPSCGCEKVNNKIKTLLSDKDRLHNGVNIIEEKYGELTVKELINPLGIIKYRCECSCGKNTIVRFDHLNNGETRSCGCKRKELLSEANKKSFGESAFNDIYNAYKQGSKARGIYFNLTKEQFRKITQENCSYCGIPPFKIRVVKGNNGSYTFNGVDRSDNTKGYIIDNCVPCCEMCNRMKLDYKMEDFKNQIARIYNYLFK